MWEPRTSLDSEVNIRNKLGENGLSDQLSDKEVAINVFVFVKFLVLIHFN